MPKRLIILAIAAMFAAGSYYLYGMFMGDYYIARAQEIEKGDDWNTAINAYRRAVDYAPGNPEYRLMFGRFYVRFAKSAKDPGIKKKLFEDAWRRLDSARDISPKDARIYLALAEAAEGLSNLDSDVSHPPEHYYRAALSRAPNSTQHLYLFARYYRRVGRDHEALRLIEQMINTDPRTERYLRRNRFWDIPGVDIAVESGLRQAINNRFTRAPAAALLASMLARSGKWADAASVYRSAMPEGRFADLTGYYLTLGNYVLRAEDEKQAEAYFSLAVENAPDRAAAVRRLASSYTNAGKPDQLLALLEQLGARHPRLADIEICRAQALYGLKDYQAARERLAELLKTGETAEADYWMAMALDRLEQPYEAETYIKRAIKWAPENAAYRHFYAGLLYNAWRFSDALEEADAAIAASGGKNPWYLDRKAWILYRMKRYEESIEAWKQASALKPDHEGFKRNMEKALEAGRRA